LFALCMIIFSSLYLSDKLSWLSQTFNARIFVKLVLVKCCPRFAAACRMLIPVNGMFFRQPPASKS